MCKSDVYLIMVVYLMATKIKHLNISDMYNQFLMQNV